MFIVSRTIYENCIEYMPLKRKYRYGSAELFQCRNFPCRHTPVRKCVDYLSFLQLFTTSPDSVTRPMTFGITMS